MSLAAFLLARGDPPDAIARVHTNPLFSFVRTPKEGLEAWNRGDLVGQEPYLKAHDRLEAIVQFGRRHLMDSVSLKRASLGN